MDHTLENGTLCDGKPSDHCDNWFEICMKKYTRSYQTKPCEYLGRTYVLGNDDFAFPTDAKAIGTNMTNPVLFKFKGPWTVSLVSYRAQNIARDVVAEVFEFTCKGFQNHL